ncbi:Formamidopyrimidine-DNA glycosylase [Mesoplasma sp. JKS002660]|uniref:DNA-formamidopyrimidine glycosylase n=1 Tax=Mesoplasma whartonense TaxID=2878854 RepID=UPI002022B320|nr:DNA-formamidopyrimidine glycosylase [Mesoplasma sp. JKS002660]MCL8213610.1 Formamidopyrimidine-DNA glycosylase [Mesoplasma sp. JKS002660]
MPELPEVRVVVNYLNQNVKGKVISAVRVFYNRLLVETSVLDLKDKLVNQQIEGVDAYGKYIIFHLTNYEMISHLRMEGKWIFESDNFFSYPQDLVEAEIEFEHEAKVLRYYDFRRFGTLQLVAKNQWKTLPAIAKLGYEPFDKGASADYLFTKVHSSSRAIKTLLLDQTILLGLGNIYVNEVLFQAKIHPLESGKNLTLQDCALILQVSKEILGKSIEEGGTTIHSFMVGNHQSGHYQKYLQVHGRENLPCFVCGTKIKKINVNGRGTYYCSWCQKLKKI